MLLLSAVVSADALICRSKNGLADIHLDGQLYKLVLPLFSTDGWTKGPFGFSIRNGRIGEDTHADDHPFLVPSSRRGPGRGGSRSCLSLPGRDIVTSDKPQPSRVILSTSDKCIRAHRSTIVKTARQLPLHVSVLLEGTNNDSIFQRCIIAERRQDTETPPGP